MSRDGFADDDPVVILGRIEPLLPALLQPDGRWLLPDVAPLDLPGFTPQPEAIVVVDSGIRADHPSLVGRVVDELDLTGEGPEDLHGHGTAVAAILATTSPWADIISVKALDRHGQSTVATLRLALREAARLVAGRGRVANVSAGRRTPTCNGDCPLCSTVGRIQNESDLMFVCAAGNLPDVTYCPAKVAISVSTPAEWDAPGDVTHDVPGWK